MQRAVAVKCDITLGDEGLYGSGQSDLRLLRCLVQQLQGIPVVLLFQIHARFPFEFFNQPVLDYDVEVVASQVSVAVNGFSLEHAVANFEDGNIEGASTEVNYGNRGITLMAVYAPGQRAGHRLSYDSQYLQAGNRSGVNGSPSLAIIEIRRYGDDCLRNGLPEFGLRILLKLLQHQPGNMLRWILLPFYLNAGYSRIARHNFIWQMLGGIFYFRVVKAAPHNPFHRIDGVQWIQHCLLFRNLSDNRSRAIGGDGDY